jgi:predicted transcriptional regulator
MRIEEVTETELSILQIGWERDEATSREIIGGIEMQ